MKRPNVKFSGNPFGASRLMRAADGGEADWRTLQRLVLNPPLYEI
jgi:hypothetical protein